MFTKDTTILNIVADYPATQAVFRSYDQVVGKCTMCENLFETVEEFAELYQLNLAKLMSELKAVL